MQPNHKAGIQVCRFSMIIFLSLILLHYFMIMKHRSRHFLMLWIGHDAYHNWGTGITTTTAL